jgi:hypothetical protein
MSDFRSFTSPKDKFYCYLRNAMQKIESSAKSARDIVMEFIQATTALVQPMESNIDAVLLV